MTIFLFFWDPSLNCVISKKGYNKPCYKEVAVYKFTYLMANSADPDQKPTDLDLHYLQVQDISGFSRTRVIKNFACGELIHFQSRQLVKIILSPF